MAIFPITNYYVVNYDVLRSSSFKAGMALMRDSNGYAIKADRSLSSTDTLSEQLGKYIGFASGDHDTLNNIILSDPVGSNYLDSNNVFRDNVNSQYGVFKRSISEFSDENVNRYYNVSDNSLMPQRGVAVYNLKGESYITDQFVPVLASTFAADSRIATTLSPGDYLTFGAGINAGKLVKVDTTGNGPSVLIVGIVEKHDTGTNLLTFTLALEYYSNTLSIITTGLYLNLDASNSTSYPSSGTTWYDLSGNSLNGSMNNGTTWYPTNGGIMRLDSTDDQIVIDDNPIFDFSGDFSIEIMYYPNEFTLHGILGKWVTGGSLVGNTWIIGSFFSAYGTGSSIFWNSLTTAGGVSVSTPTLYENFNWYSITITRSSGLMSIYVNGIFEVAKLNTPNFTNTNPIIITQWASFNAGADVALIRFYNNALSAQQVQNNYNHTYNRMFV